MLRKSFEKFDISVSKTLMRETNELYATTAGIAANRPAAVASSALPMGAATVVMVALPFSAISLKAPRMPITVPNRPTKGAVLPTVPRKGTCASSVVISASRRAAQRALDVFDAAQPLAHRAFFRGLLVLRQLRELFVAGAEHARERAGLELLRRRVDGVEAVRRLPERVEEGHRLGARLAQLHRLHGDERPRVGRRETEQNQHRQLDRPTRS